MTDRDGSRPDDPIADFQRWIVRSSARGLGSQLKGQVRRTLRGSAPARGDVWETATSEPPAEAPECAWCPVCRAARRLRDSGPGLASQVAGAGDALLSMAQDTLAAVDATLSARPQGTWPGPGSDQPHGGPARRASEGTGWPGEDPPAPHGAREREAAPGEPDHRP